MKHLGLFEGIGGFSLAARWMGWETLAWCEWNEFGQKVLRHHFPEAEGFGDIKKTDFTKYANRIDIITGGFPCQPYSGAGKRKGKADERHLWPEMLRAIREVQPSYVVGENVRGLTNWNGGLVFDEVQADLEAEGYEVLPFLLPACAVNAPHRRDRIWFVAHSDINARQEFAGNLGCKNGEYEKKGLEFIYNAVEHNGNEGNATDTNRNGLHECSGNQWKNFPTQSPICGGNDGVPTRLYGITFSKWRNESIKAYGNAIVPQIAYELFKAIEATDNLFNKAQNLP